MPNKYEWYVGTDSATDIHDLYRVTMCDSHDCKNGAEVTLLWTNEWHNYCRFCARWLLKVAGPEGLGHQTPQATIRKLARREMLQSFMQTLSDELPDKQELDKVKDALELHAILYGEDPA